MTESVNLEKDFFYPPGGILIWIIIILELATFSFGLIAMVTYGKDNMQLYHDTCSTLNKNMAFANTNILLSSGFFMAEALKAVKLKNKTKSKLFLKLTIFFGLTFVIIKLVDYYLKIHEGIGITTNIFYTFYWFLTFFHFMHVVLGIIFLAYFLFKIDNIIEKSDFENIESGAAFWHMCDLIWLLLFPIIFLIY